MKINAIDTNQSSRGEVKLPNIFSKSYKLNELNKLHESPHLTLNKEAFYDKAKFINYFEEKKEGKNFLKNCIKFQKIKLANSLNQTMSTNEYKDNSNRYGNFVPKIIQQQNYNNYSPHKSFQDNRFSTVNGTNEHNHIFGDNQSKYNPNYLYLSDNENENLTKNSFDRKATHTNSQYTSITPNKLDQTFKKKKKIYPAKILIKNDNLIEEEDMYTNILKNKTNYKNLSSNIDLKLKVMQTRNKKSNDLYTTTDNSNKTIKELNEKGVNELSKTLNFEKKKNTENNKRKKINVLKSFLEIKTLDDSQQKNINLKNKFYINIQEERTEKFDSELDMSNGSSKKTSLLNRFHDNQIDNLLSRFSKQNPIESKKEEKKLKSYVKKGSFFNKDKDQSRNDIHKHEHHYPHNSSNFSENNSFVNKSLISDYEVDLRKGLKREMHSETEIERIENQQDIAHINSKKNKKNNSLCLNNSMNVSFGGDNSQNLNNYYLNLYEDIQKIKNKMDNFIKNDMKNMISNDFIEEIFKGVIYHKKSDFDYYVKKEFLFLAYVSNKFAERLSFKKSSQRNLGLPVPGGEYKLVHTGLTNISIKVIRNEDEINYEYLKKSKKNFLILILEYNMILNEILLKLTKNISDFIRFLNSLNCLKINRLFIEFHFTNIYVLKNENIFIDNKIVFKLIEYLTNETNYCVTFPIFYKLRLYSLEEIQELTLENYYFQVNFIRGYLKYFLGDVTEKDKINKILDDFKNKLKINFMDLNVFLDEELIDIKKHEKIKSFRFKVANIYLTLIKLVI